MIVKFKNLITNLNTKTLIKILVFLALILATIGVKAEDFNRNIKNYNNKLQIFEDDKKVAEFMVAIADNQDKRNYGLMNLNEMGSNFGMLFIFEDLRIINMWMKNTIIPLDMIFIDENNRIVNIESKTEPLSLNVISSKKKAKYVLEINQNLSKKLKIKIGQKVKYEKF